MRGQWPGFCREFLGLNTNQADAHTHTQTVAERERERERESCLFVAVSSVCGVRRRRKNKWLNRCLRREHGSMRALALAGPWLNCPEILIFGKHISVSREGASWILSHVCPLCVLCVMCVCDVRGVCDGCGVYDVCDVCLLQFSRARHGQAKDRICLFVRCACCVCL